MSDSNKLSVFRDAGTFLRHNRGSSLLAMTLFGASVGMGGLLGVDVTFEATSTTEFCIGCHEMQILYEELEATAHAKNRTGVRVGCADCHVPRTQPDKLIAKVRALDDIYAHLIGTIDTPEKFEAKRLEMAEKVWDEMGRSGASGCRTCHSFDAMAFSKQGSRPAYKHNQAIASGETCIDCHKGVAHRLPAGFRNDDY